ncbi:ABC transporter substrate-binding protein [Paenibacillus sp. GCM10027626]|uniref:ABC transporter substrate-binding protein n=1 Tax=Paenibacillus sp. GCM10027626 TaxID=3273411 RepID=UPI003631F797
MKKTTTLMLAAALLLGNVAGCSSGKESGSQTDETPVTGNAGDKRTITFSTITNYYTDGLKQAAEDYSKLHPETTVKIDIVTDNSTYQTSFQAKMAAGGKDAPDIVHANLLGDSSGNNIKKGWLLPLNDFVKQPNPYNNKTALWDGIDENYHPYAYTENGDIFMLPFDLVGTGFYYNKTIFDKLGLEVPTSWEDLLATLQKLKDANYIPLSMSFTVAADYTGWMKGTFMDWTARQYIPDILVQKGDARNTPEIEKVNSKVHYAADDPFFDVGAIRDPERIMALWKSGKYDAQGPAEQKYWQLLKDLSKFYQPGYTTMSDPDCYKLFISGKAAIYWNGSWQVGQLVKDQQKLGDKGFEWGTFKFPNFKTPDPNFPGEPRGILVPGHQLSIVNKQDDEQKKRAEDFMMYLYSPEIAQKVYETTLNAGQFVQGPSLVKGVKLSDEINGYLKGFLTAGNMIGDLGMIANGNPTGNTTLSTEFKTLELQFFDDKVTLEEFLKKKAEFTKKTNEQYIADNKFDLDPATNP